MKKPLPIFNGGERHAGRAGIRYGILGPTENGKTTMLVRLLREWEEDNPKLPVYSNIRIYKQDKQHHQIPDPQVKIYHSPTQWKALKRHPGLLVCDEISVYLNSLLELNEQGKLRVLFRLAQNLTKQDMEWIYTDQHALSLHKRVRINVNKIFAPNYEPEFHRVNYYVFNSLQGYIDYFEGGGGRVTGLREYHFDAREVFPYFNTKEIVTSREKHFNVINETKKLVEWYEKTKTPFLVRHMTDAINYYLEKNKQSWTEQQRTAIRYGLKLKYDQNNGGQKNG